MYPNDKRKKSLSISGEDVLRLCREGDLTRLRRILEDEDQYQRKILWSFGKNESPLLYEAVEHSQTLIVRFLYLITLSLILYFTFTGTILAL